MTRGSPSSGRVAAHCGSGRQMRTGREGTRHCIGLCINMGLPTTSVLTMVGPPFLCGAVCRARASDHHAASPPALPCPSPMSGVVSCSRRQTSLRARRATCCCSVRFHTSLLSPQTTASGPTCRSPPPSSRFTNQLGLAIFAGGTLMTRVQPPLDGLRAECSRATVTEKRWVCVFEKARGHLLRVRITLAQSQAESVVRPRRTGVNDEPMSLLNVATSAGFVSSSIPREEYRVIQCQLIAHARRSYSVRFTYREHEGSSSCSMRSMPGHQGGHTSLPAAPCPSAARFAWAPCRARATPVALFPAWHSASIRLP